EELHRHAAGIDQRQPVRATVLDARHVHYAGAVAGALVAGGAREREAGVLGAAAAVVEADAPASQAGASRSDDFDALAAVAAGAAARASMPTHHLRAVRCNPRLRLGGAPGCPAAPAAPAVGARATTRRGSGSPGSTQG